MNAREKSFVEKLDTVRARVEQEVFCEWLYSTENRGRTGPCTAFAHLFNEWAQCRSEGFLSSCERLLSNIISMFEARDAEKEANRRVWGYMQDGEFHTAGRGAWVGYPDMPGPDHA